MKREKFEHGSTLGRLFNGRAFVVLNPGKNYMRIRLCHSARLGKMSRFASVKTDRVFAY